MAIYQVIEEKWGPFYPLKLVSSQNDDDIKQARDSMQAMIFLAGADKYRYEKFLNQMNNNYLAKKDEYPKSIESALELLRHYKDHQSGGSKGGDSKPMTETSFAQYQEWLAKTNCHECGQLGHIKKNCPRLRQQHLQQQDETGSVGNGSIRSAYEEEALTWSG